jgi:tetratricopeptide (TPR) repeat protein
MGESGDAPVNPPNYDHLSTQLSVLLAEMVKTQEVAVADAWSPEVRPGGSIGRFLLTRELGRGGFGVVYEAVDGELNRTVALKVVRPGTRIAARGNEWLLREAEAVARLNHPNIVTLHDFGQGPSGPYLVFELLRGRSLSDQLRAGAIPLDQVIDVGIAVSRALVHAHGAGVIHRDLTAANVFLVEEGAGGGGQEEAARASPRPTAGRGHSPGSPELGPVKVLDFGLAHLFGRDGANDGGTPAYMAPEQWEGDRGDGRTDLFALGVILFQALTGRFPYKVDKGWSEALEPGETPRVPRAAAPGPLRRLVRVLLDREPELRPEHARAVRDALLALRKERDGAGRRRVLGAALGVAGAAVAVAGWLFMQREAPPGEQVRVVVAAMENGAGEPTLDAVPGLLSTALEPSPRVKVVPPTRLAYVARQAGLGELGKLDAARGAALARLVGAPVVLVPSAWQEDSRSVLAVRAVESESGRVLFTARVPVARPNALATTIDQLSERVRRKLNERTDDQKWVRPVAEAVTASPEAARYYYEGLDCVRRSSTLPAVSCAPSFERALAFDPTFPLAHYQLAALNFIQGDSGEAARPHVSAAARGADRLPEKEATLVRALAARLDGKLDEALQGYDALLAAEPEDPQILAAASELQIQRSDWGAALKYLEKLVAVVPDEDTALLSLIEADGRLNRTAELSALLERLRAERPRRTRPVVEAAVWLGRHDEAVEAARRGVSERGASELGTLWFALYAAGHLKEMEKVAHGELEARPGDWTARNHLELTLACQGRVGEALRYAMEGAPLRPQATWGQSAHRQAMFAVATGDRELVWRHAARAFALDPGFSSDLAVVLALMGDATRAEPLARRLKSGSVAEAEYRALQAWRGGDVAGALAQLTAAEVRDPYPVDGIAPAYLIAEVSAAAGDDLSTLTSVSRFQRLPPRGTWRAWAYPRSLILAATAHLRVGDRATARRELEQALQVLERADPSLPMVKQARELRSKL